MTSTRSSARIAVKYKTKPFFDLHSSSEIFYASSSDEESDSDSHRSTLRKTKSKLPNLDSSPPKQSKLERTSRILGKIQSTTNTPSLERLSLVSPTKSNSTRKSLFKENNNAKSCVAKTELTKKIRKIDTSSSEDSQSEDDSADEESDSDSHCSNPRKTKSKLSNLESSPQKQSKLKRTSRILGKVQSTTNTPSLERLSLVSPTKSNCTRKNLFKENNAKSYVVKTEFSNKIRKIDTSSSEDDILDKDSDPHRSTPRKTKSKLSNLESSPSKQSKLENPSRILEKVQSMTNTPSLERLSLVSPKSNSTRKSLFKENNNSKSYVAKTKLTKKTLQIDTSSSEDSQSEDDISKNKTIYQCARQALHGSLPSELPGRENEIKQLKDFIEEHLQNKASGSLYVSGPPGTGKTACLNTIIKENVEFKLAHVYINCTAIKSPTAIYSRIIKELNLKANGKTEKDHLMQIDKYLRKNHKPILLVLDEIDQLESKNQSILYTIFEWPSKPNSQLLLIGIANALDLTDRVLPRLQTRCELKPRLMHFAPYTKQQIIEIVTSRLRSAGVLEIFSPSAVQMLAGKVASVSGDIRRALDIGRRVIELADKSKNNGALKSVENLANQLIEDEMKTVDLKQVLTILNNIYSTTQSLNENSEDSFPLQQKIIICSLLLMLKKVKNKDITVGKLHEVYRRVCDKRKMGSVDQAEFVGLISLIETRGIIRISRKKEQRLNKVGLMWDEEEVRSALKDQQLISEILRDESCLGRL